MKFCCTVKIYDSAKRTSCLLMAGGSLQQLQEHKHGPVFASHKQYLPYRNISLSTNRTIQVTQSTPKTKDSIKNTYSSQENSTRQTVIYMLALKLKSNFEVRGIDSACASGVRRASLRYKMWPMGIGSERQEQALMLSQLPRAMTAIKKSSTKLLYKPH